MRQLWVCYKKRQLAVRHYCRLVWPHAIHNCLSVRIIHARDLSNSSITLTSKGHTRLFSHFPLVSNKIRPVCVAPHVIETEKIKAWRLPTVRYRLKKWHISMKNQKQKSSRTYSGVHIISYQYEYFWSARTPVTKSNTRDHTASLFCFIQRTTSINVSYEYSYEYAWTI